VLVGRGWKLLLAIDSSSGTSAAVFNGETMLSHLVFEDPFGHAENIGQAIVQALSKSGISAKDLTSVAVGRGPAPYTGLRVGMAAGIAFANTLQLEIHGVMVLDAIAHFATGSVVVTTDAKRGELFVAAYENGQRVNGPSVISPQDLLIPEGYRHITQGCDAQMVGQYAIAALAKGVDLSDVSALYLRSADVTPSKGKRVSG
jgi:tRNA threonylcarbamoyladenosine biosynthesis protein TsaB